MTELHLLIALLALAGLFLLGLVGLLVEQVRWNRAHRRLYCMTCGNYHPRRNRHAKH
ncbi:hypothetical protein ABZ649_04755 [Streptomyces albidoflavus]|uniref:hypothetical protein n=1 Tax=Streptomyces albidoflavus TaxID=1886 RepID=UPI0033DF04BE